MSQLFALVVSFHLRALFQQLATSLPHRHLNDISLTMTSPGSSPFVPHSSGRPLSFEGTSFSSCVLEIPPLQCQPSFVRSVHTHGTYWQLLTPISPFSPDYLALNAVLFEWADAYDSKDWDRLSRVLAPTLNVDYRSFLDQHWPAMPKSEFLSLISSPSVLGSRSLRTQHFIGASRWVKVADDEVLGYHQLRVPHQKYRSDDCKEGDVLVKGHAHSTNVHWYKKVDGVWKFAGLAPDIRWTEYDFEKVFEHGRTELVAAKL